MISFRGFFRARLLPAEGMLEISGFRLWRFELKWVDWVTSPKLKEKVGGLARISEP